jgi:uncharacterized protein (TIGR02246 family)
MMTRALAATAVLVLSASLAFAQAPAQAPPPAAAPAGAEALADVRRAIDRGNAQWAEGWAKGDAAMVAAIFADDGVQLAGSGKIIKGPQQIRDRQKTAMQGADPGVKVTITTVSVWLDGDTAYETGKYKYEYKEKGKPGVDEGRYVTIWKHQKDGSWKLSMDMGVPQ